MVETLAHRHGLWTHEHHHHGPHRHPRLPFRSHDEPGHRHDDEHGHTHGRVDRSIVRSRAGVRAVSVSLAILALTAALQVVVFALSGSVALLADLIHNGGDALTAIPLGIAFLLAANGRALGRLFRRPHDFRERHRRRIRRNRPARASPRSGLPRRTCPRSVRQEWPVPSPFALIPAGLFVGLSYGRSELVVQCLEHLCRSRDRTDTRRTRQTAPLPRVRVQRRGGRALHVSCS